MDAAMTASASIQFWGGDTSLNAGRDVYLSSRRYMGERSLAEVAASVLLDWAKNVPPRQEQNAAPITVELQLPGVSVSERDEFLRRLVRLSNATPWAERSEKNVTAEIGSFSSLRRTLLEYELLNSIDIEPDAYPLPTGESTFDFIYNAKRITCIFDDSYCHILADISGVPEDQVFEGNDLQPSAIGQHFRSLVEKLKKSN